MRDRAVFVLIAIAVFLVATLLTIAFQARPIAVKSVEAQVKVASVVGINLDTDKLYFGTVIPGGSAKRGLTVTAPQDTFVVLSIEGQHAVLFTPNKRSALLAKGENETFLFTASVPAGLADGNYSANVTVSFYRPFVRLLA